MDAELGAVGTKNGRAYAVGGASDATAVFSGKGGKSLISGAAGETMLAAVLALLCCK